MTSQISSQHSAARWAAAAGNFSPSRGRKASLKICTSSGPQHSSMGTRDGTTVRTAAVSSGGQVSIGPSWVAAQSASRWTVAVGSGPGNRVRAEVSSSTSVPHIVRRSCRSFSG